MEDIESKILRNHILSFIDECYEMLPSDSPEVGKIRNRHTESTFDFVYIDGYGNDWAKERIKESFAYGYLVEYIKQTGKGEVVTKEELSEYKRIKEMYDGIKIAQKEGIKW